MHPLTQLPSEPASNSSSLTSHQLTSEQAILTSDQDHEEALDKALDRILDHPLGQCLEHLHSRESSIRTQVDLMQPAVIGDNNVASHAMIHSDPLLTTSSNSDSRMHSSQQPSTSQASWRHESPTSHSESPRIYNRWLNKEVPFTMKAYNSSSSNIRNNQPMISHTNSSNPTTTTEQPSLTSKQASRNLNNSFPGTTALLNTSNQTPISNKDTHLSQYQSPLCPSSKPHRLDSSQVRMSLKAYNSDSNLATSYTEERRQNLLKMHREHLAPSVNSLATAFKREEESPQTQQVKRRRERSPRFPPHQLQIEESQPPRAELNKRKAETLWGKQLGLDENQTLCRNSLPRQPPQHEAKSKQCRSIDDELEAVEIEIQDILAQPLIAEITISSPSLFDETPTSSSISSSPPVTVQILR